MYFHSAISDYLSIAISMSPEWMALKTDLTVMLNLHQLDTESLIPILVHEEAV